MPENLNLTNVASTSLNNAAAPMLENTPNLNVTVNPNDKLFFSGAYYPPIYEIERLSKYKRGERIFDGKTYDVFRYGTELLRFPSDYAYKFYDVTHLYEVYNRARDILKDTPFNDQLQKLYIAVNVIDILLTKVADLMVGEPPIFESGKPTDSPEQAAVNRIVENNRIIQLLHEITIGAGIRGDAFLKVFYNYRQDFSGIPNGASIPEGVNPEPIIEAVDPSWVFPELSIGSTKKFRALNIAYVDWMVDVADQQEIPTLFVERHTPGYVTYERFRLYAKAVDRRFGPPIQMFVIGEPLPTGKDTDIVETGVPFPLLIHIPYKSIDTDWAGISGIQKIESVLAALNDTISRIDYVLQKNMDPVVYGPPIDGMEDQTRVGGRYITLNTKDDVVPGYMEFGGHLDAAFKEIDLLLNQVFMMSETPQWLFGDSLTSNGNAGGSGTSHTDGMGIQARFMPITSKVARVRLHMDKGIKDAMLAAQLLEQYANKPLETPVYGDDYEAIIPTILWKDGIPKDISTLTNVVMAQTGGKVVLDVLDAIKMLHDCDDEQALEIMARIEADEKRQQAMTAVAQPTAFNNEPPKFDDNEPKE